MNDGRGRWERPPSEETLPRRFLSRVGEPDENGCWPWLGAPGGHGYGQIQTGRVGSTGNRMPDLAHRVSYQFYVGPIPDGMTIDHLCRNRMCVNPSHMEVVTVAENSRRGATKRYCQNGHLLAETAYVYPTGRRECHPCKLNRTRAWRNAA